MPPNYVDLHKFIWHPDDFDEDGKVRLSAFSKSDLGKTSGRYMSVQRMDKFSGAAVLQTIERQQEKANGEDIRREDAHSIFWRCGELRELADNDGQKPFSVTYEPVLAKPELNVLADPAHCGVHNVTGIKKDSYILQLREMLVKAIRESCAFEETLSANP